MAASSLVPSIGKTTASRPSAEILSRPGARAVVVGVHHQLGPAPQRLVGAGVHVADDHVGLVARLDQRVGAAVDPHQQRAVLGDVRPKRIQVAAVVVAADHDQHVPALDPGRHVGYADPLEQQLLLLAEVGHGVLGEGLDLVRQPLPRVLQLLLEDLGGVESALGEQRTVRCVDLAAVQGELIALVRRAEDLVADVVDQHDPGVHQDARTEVGIAAGHRRHGVDHRAHPRLDQCLRADPVQVRVVDDGDLARPEPFGQILGPPVEPCHATDLGRRSAPAEQCRQSHLA